MVREIFYGINALANLVWLLESKNRVLDKLGEKLSSESKVRASKDSHSRRKPRPCGITIHTGIGCNYACTYCYIYDMGFPAKSRPYPLRSEEVVYALALNPYVVPEKTLAAYGSVTEPFLPETTERTLSYMREVYRQLRLPTQVSTKAILTEEVLKEISSGDPHMSVLVTVVTLSNRRLEPRAPRSSREN
ncbi:MAG: radical SAM protein [Candidatus Bathyarchaeia archaeon]